MSALAPSSEPRMPHSRSRSSLALQPARPRPLGAAGRAGRLAAAVTALIMCGTLFLLASFLSTGPGASAACNSEDLEGGSRAGRLPHNASVRVVVARWAEDAAWVGHSLEELPAGSTPSSAAVHIYQLGGADSSEGAGDPGLAAIDKRAAKARRRQRGGASLAVHAAPDKGGEAVAFLSAIVDGWDSLPDVMVFLHGHDSSWHSRVPNSWVLSKLLQRPPSSLMGGYMGTQCRPPGGEYNFRLRPANISANPRREQPGARFLAQAWREYFGQHLGQLPALLEAPRCAEFAVSRAAIRRHGKEFYAGAKDWILQTSLGSKQAARALEYAWHLMFQDRATLRVGERACLCALYGVPTVSYWDKRLLALLALPPGVAAVVLLRPLLAAAVRRRGRQRLPA